MRRGFKVSLTCFTDFEMDSILLFRLLLSDRPLFAPSARESEFELLFGAGGDTVLVRLGKTLGVCEVVPLLPGLGVRGPFRSVDAASARSCASCNLIKSARLLGIPTALSYVTFLRFAEWRFVPTPLSVGSSVGSVLMVGICG